MFRFVLILSVSLLAVHAQKKTWTDAEVMKVHRSAILIDGHNDVTSDTVKGMDIGPLRSSGHTDAVRMKKGGMGAQFFAAYVGAEYMEKNGSAHRALEMIDTIRYDIVEKHPNDFVLARTADGIVKARKQGKIAALIGIEGGHAIEGSERLLRDFYALGVRYMTLTHSKNHEWAGSSGEKDNVGLSAHGKEIVAEMNRLGMMVDIAHVSDKTFWDVIETSKSPVFSSHSSARAVSNIARNMTDEMLRAVGKKGGLVMVNFGCEFLSQKSADTSSWTNPNAKTTKCEQATIDDVVAQINHIRKVAGVDAVGLGSDFDGVSCVPKGLEDVSQWPNLTRKLLEVGYTPAEIRKVYGGNLLRFMRSVERTSRELGGRPS